MVVIRPYKATHALLETKDKRKALVVVDDFDTLAGTAGKVTWMKLTKTEREIIDTFEFDGKIEEIVNDYHKKNRGK